MKDLRLLLSLYLRSFMGINRAVHTQDTAERRRIVGMLLVYAVLGVFYTFAFTVQTQVADGSSELTGFASLVMVVTLLALLTGLTGGSTELLAFKDHDMLLAMPLDKKMVVLSRLIVQYLSTAVMVLIFAPGAVISYCNAVDADVWFALRAAALLAFVPAIPLVLSSLLSIAISRLTANARFRNALRTVVPMAIMLAAFAFVYGGMGGSLGSDAGSLDAVYAGFSRVYPPCRWFTAAIAGDWRLAALFAGVSAAALAACYGLLYLRFDVLYDRINTPGAVKGGVGTELKFGRRSRLGALVRRELGMYFSMPAYVMNTLFGYVVCVLAGVAALVFGARVRALLGGISFVEPVIAVVFMQLVSIAPQTGCSISAEGRCLWRIRSLPVSSRELFGSKLAAQLVFALPAGLFGVMCVSIGLGLGWEWALAISLATASSAVMAAVLGLWVNLARPKLDWQNEVEFVKQSVSTLLCMLLGFGLAIIPGAAGIALALAGMTAVAAAVYGVWGALLLALALLLYRRLCARGPNRLSALQ
ncbi:MAG: hypothetical protein Q4B99_05385 [Clostridia bacterium]|nr:hypothetical protein [Clostridia bacterium]